MNSKKFINSDYLKNNPLCGIDTYKDKLNLATGACTRKIKKLVLNGTENWVLYNGNYYSSVTDRYSLQNTPCRCTHTAGGIVIDNGSVRLKVFASRFTAVASNLEEWKTYLQQQYQNGVPVIVWYFLAEPTTETITVPSGLSGTEEGYLIQDGTPTPTNPIYPTANTVEKWFDSPHYIHKTDTDTITTLPTVIYANDTTATVGLKGNMEQSGTPSPTTPIQPSECGERTGNLFDYTKTDGIIANKYINQSGAIVADNEYYISYPIKVDVGETYTWRFDSNSSAAGHTAPTVGFYDSSDNLLSTAQHNVTVKYFSFEVPTNCAYIRASVFTRSNAQKEAMLNAGSTPLPYEPYGYFIEIEVS